MKTKLFRGYIVLISLVAGYFTIGFLTDGSLDPIMGKLMARPGKIHFTNKTETPLEVFGEAVISEGEDVPGDRARTAATIDALKKFAINRRDAKTYPVDHSRDTTYIEQDWDGLRLNIASVRSYGIVIEEDVSVELNDSKPTLQWKISNMRLVIPAESKDPMLQQLTKALAKRNMESHGGRRIGRSIWQETIVMKQKES